MTYWLRVVAYVRVLRPFHKRVKKKKCRRFLAYVACLEYNLLRCKFAQR